VRVLVVEADSAIQAVLGALVRAQWPDAQVCAATDAVVFAEAMVRGGIDLCAVRHELPWADASAVLTAVQRRAPGVRCVCLTTASAPQVLLALGRRCAEEAVWHTATVDNAGLAGLVSAFAELDRTWTDRRTQPRPTGWQAPAANGPIAAAPPAIADSPPPLPAATLHDLHEPLRSVDRYLQSLLCRHEAHLVPEARDLVDKARGAAGRMRQRLDALTAPPHGAAPSDDVCDANEVLRQTVADLDAIVASRAAQVRAGPLPTLAVRPADLAAVLQNLVSNAIKFCSAATPVVEIGAEADGDQWQLWVADNGPGVAFADRQRIFGMFERGAGGQGQPGSGIGLAVCARTVRRWGGRIWVEDNHPAGARFLWTAPGVVDAASDAAGQAVAT